MKPLPVATDPEWRDAHELSLSLVEAMREDREDDILFVLASMARREEGPGYTLAVACLAKLVCAFADERKAAPGKLRAWAQHASLR